VRKTATKHSSGPPLLLRAMGNDDDGIGGRERSSNRGMSYGIVIFLGKDATVVNAIASE